MSDTPAKKTTARKPKEAAEVREKMTYAEAMEDSFKTSIESARANHRWQSLRAVFNEFADWMLNHPEDMPADSIKAPFTYEFNWVRRAA
jgi:hypothetical protein